jgi:hypothetical protein
MRPASFLLYSKGLPERLEKGALANSLIARYQCHSVGSRRGRDEAIGGIVGEVVRELPSQRCNFRCDRPDFRAGLLD